MKIATVEQFVRHKVLPEHRPIVSLLRKIMRESAPGAKEVISYGILAWRANRILAVISPTRKDITLAFSRGADFADKYKLLHGVGKVSKHVKFATVQQVKPTPLCYYIRQALKFDAAPK